MDESKDEAKHESVAEMNARVEERILARKKQPRKNRGTGARKAAHGARLRWRSHFSQKLHDQPSIEHENMVRTQPAGCALQMRSG